MDNKYIKLLEGLLYNFENEVVIEKVGNIENSELLHIFAANYNWNNGFDVPRAIINNKYCDYGTGLLLFYYADGYRFLMDKEEVLSSPLLEWKNFITHLYEKLINLDFNTQEISFRPELSKIQVFKLRKNNPNVPEVFIEKSPGIVIDIPKI